MPAGACRVILAVSAILDELILTMGDAVIEYVGCEESWE
jgi:hypothetical protein